jgi:uncharacterized protein YndB with AHSA1/START domain
MTIILIVGALVLAAIVIVLVVAATKPDTFSIQRSRRIDAAPERVFPLINNVHEFIKWSPFEKDPNMKRTFRGPAAGPGMIYEFDGNRNVGAGRVEVTESHPVSKIVMRLVMTRPFAADNTVTFTLASAAGVTGVGTDVTWQMSGKQPFMAKVMSTIINCDRMVGGEFDKGLASLNMLAIK